MCQPLKCLGKTLNMIITQLLHFQMKVLDSIQRSSETYRAKCHKQQLEISELELALGHWKDEKGSLQRSYDELRNMYEIAGNQCKVLKAEKEELEELLGTRNGRLCK